MSTTSNDENELNENFQKMEFNDNQEERVIKEIEDMTTSSSSSSCVLDDELFENASDPDNLKIKKKLLMQQLKDIEEKEAVLKQKEQNEKLLIGEINEPPKAKWNNKGELNFFSSDEDEEGKAAILEEKKQIIKAKNDKKVSSTKNLVNQDLIADVERWDEAKARQMEMRSYRPPLKSSVKGEASKKAQESPKSIEAIKLIEEIRSRSPPRIKLGKTTRVTMAQVHAENVKRCRASNEQREPEKLKGTNRARLTTDDPNAKLAPSTVIRPAPYEAPTFREFLKEMGLDEKVKEEPTKPLYLVECRLLSEEALKDLIIKRARMLVARKDSQTVTRGTQTYVSHSGKPRIQGCVNCRSCTHHARDCKLPYRPGFCQICFADGYDTKDCVYPHGVEHEAALGLCVGCGRDLSLYCPECPDCNIRYKDIVDWLRLNYATWPTWAIPADHRYLVNEGSEILKRRVKAKFDDPKDTPNRVREFLIRENALSIAPRVASRDVQSMEQLSEEKRQLALQALMHPLTNKTLDEVMKERPELDDGEEVKILLPTKYQHRATKE
ncbi:hypothetical protein PV326_014396 [Microctonus aethiopoides]|nr:hypothetical protein PV326_014396 [Microctonus aethiopoides]